MSRVFWVLPCCSCARSRCESHVRRFRRDSRITPAAVVYQGQVVPPDFGNLDQYEGQIFAALDGRRRIIAAKE